MNGYLASKFGYRWVMIGAMGLLNAFIFAVFFAPNAGALVGGQILCGLCWGVFATLSPAYGECKPGQGLTLAPPNSHRYLT